MDMIDEALLRPGRLELKLQVVVKKKSIIYFLLTGVCFLQLPDEDGREQTVTIHTKKMRDNNILDNVDIAGLAAHSKSFSGAEIAGAVRSAVSYASERCVELSPHVCDGHYYFFSFTHRESLPF
jgi:vesicle-fusing ATPase